ncbi:WD40 repeat-like protein [Meredithblackwellia eburnea MCA 4105]
MAPEASPVTIKAEAGAPKGHCSLEVKFPVYAIDFINDTIVILAGGGGSSRTGVKNRLSMYKIDPSGRQFDLVEEHELSKQEDAPMSIAVDTNSKSLIAGVNSSVEVLKQGTNENLRVFSYTDSSITSTKQLQTLLTTSEDHYQKTSVFAPKGDFLAVGGTNSQISLLTFPALEEVYKPPLKYDEKEEDEIFDTDFSEDGRMLVGTSSKKLCVWSTKPSTSSDEGEKSRPEPIQTIERPVLKKELACTFRGAKFGRGKTTNNIYTIVNASPAVRSRKPKQGEKKSFVSLWDTKSWTLVKTRTVSMRPVTAFDVSKDGTLLAYGSSDLSVGILDAVTLRSIMTILQAHNFPVTSLKFNPSASLVISGSADNTVRVITVPPAGERGSFCSGSWIWNLVVTILILILAIAVQQGLGDDVMRVARGTLGL